jgi:hypothetical protein
MFRGSVRRALAAVLLATVATASPAAWADEEESDEAAVLVQQAVALLANENSPEVVLERIEDAAEAPITEGVDLEQVEEAAALVEPLVEQGEDRFPPAVEEQVRGVLEASIGTPEEPEPVDRTTGTETGTTVVLEEHRPARGVSDGGDAVLLALSAAALGGGLLLARRLRPHHSLRELRRPAPVPATAAAKEPTE